MRRRDFITLLGAGRVGWLLSKCRERVMCFERCATDRPVTEILQSTTF
jgi:hypothetical protein